MSSRGYVRIQVLIPRQAIPYLEKFMQERGYEYSSQAIRRIVIEYLSSHYKIPITSLITGNGIGDKK